MSNVRFFQTLFIYYNIFIFQVPVSKPSQVVMLNIDRHTEVDLHEYTTFAFTRNPTIITNFILLIILTFS